MSCVKSFSVVSPRSCWHATSTWEAWQQAAEERCGNNSLELGGSTKTKKQKGRGSHTLGNGVSDDRTFLGDICEESKRIIFLFPPLQRYLLWHIAVLRYRKSVDIWSCIFLWVGSVIGSSETNLWRWLMLALVASVLFRQNSNAVPISTLKVRI